MLRFQKKVLFSFRSVFLQEESNKSSSNDSAEANVASGSSASEWCRSGWANGGGVAAATVARIRGRAAGQGEVGASQAGGVAGVNVDRAIAEEGSNTLSC